MCLYRFTQLFFIFSVLTGFTCRAQLFTNDNTTIAVLASTQITIQGDFQNQNGGLIRNSGTLELSGNWINNAANTVFGATTGTVDLNGVAQSIGGTNPTTFNNLNLKGTGTKTLLVNTTVGGANVTPSGVITITGSQVLDLGGKTLTVTNSATNAIQSPSTGYILGEQSSNSSVVKWTINGVLGTHTIPFGNSSAVLIPFTYNLSSGDAGDVSVSTYPTNPANLPLPATPVLVTHIRDLAGVNNSANMPDRFWWVNKSGPSGTAAYTFTYAPSENAANGNANTRAQRWNDVQEAWESAILGQVNPTAQSILVSGVNSSGIWTSALLGSPLPIELLYFKAKLSSNNVTQLNWSTASEQNSNYFMIEKSNDGIQFFDFKKVKAAANSTSIINYETIDENPFEGYTYYRLREVDFNNDEQYSDIETVYWTKDKNEQVILFPNPTNGITQLNIRGSIYSSYEIRDARSRLLLENKISYTNNESSNQINCSYLSQGIYLLVLRGKNETKTIRLEIMN